MSRKRMAMLEVNQISAKLDDFQLQGINLSIAKSDYFVLLGPSGSGKSVLLEIIAGLIKPASGHIRFDGQDITHQKIRQRKIGLMFQDNSAFPHLTVKENIEFAIRLRYFSKETISTRLNILANQFDITHLLNRHTQTLSGGELQRVLLARTLASEPKMLLLDEPLSSVDTAQKDELKSILRTINRNGLPMLHVTHDFEEAISLASTLGVMNDGKLISSGTPDQFLSKPDNEFVARFTGHKNFYRVQFTSPGIAVVNDKITVRTPPVPENIEIGSILIEPRQIILSRNYFASSAQNVFKGTVSDI
nr:ATP-binding cassette domain-containing protein [Bacteroidota bacterium]